MLRPVFIAFMTMAALSLAACADSSSDHPHRPPQDPPDYKGVPTDTRPPDMTGGSAQPK